VAADFADTFAALRGMLETHAGKLLVTADTPTDFMMAVPTKKDRIGRPLFVAGIQIRKRYVSYHLMPVYLNPALLNTLSPGLKRRMQGKACFNFTTVDRGQLKELSTLTRKGIAAFKNLPLPWDKPSKK
jgi:hypothetical protein